MKGFLPRLRWVLSVQGGINPRQLLRACGAFPRYVLDLWRFRSAYKGRMGFFPCLHDRHAEGGSTRTEYFWQDLLVARRIFEAAPVKHVDVGSRVDGFVAHVASFREIEVFDVRPLTLQVPGIIFRQADLMKLPEGMKDYCDSLSCLHALEHFGLGRYGDPLDPEGFRWGLIHMAGLLKAAGVLYLSVPVGVERVEFNAHRVFDPQAIIDLAGEQGLLLSDLTVIPPDGGADRVTPDKAQLERLARQDYALALFVFHKSAL